ncbi:MAG TPA: GTPase ObgE [Oculatellaceae cyanobacterium]
MANFIDLAVIEARSGDGGNGMIAWRRDKYEPMGGPAGGSGGRGGHVLLEATEDLNTLVDFKFKNKFEAKNGERGKPKSMNGKAGQDLVIRVPIGTVVKDATTGEVVADLIKRNQRVLVAEGGRGGRGNSLLASPTHRAPHFCEPGQAGVYRKLTLELKILADVGLVGLPNAGKSTLLSVISAAKPKIANYPFSTLEPMLGVVRVDEDTSFVAADIPGLIEGASRGVGLGHDFLRHVERTRLLLHIVDVTSENLVEDIQTILTELNAYGQSISALPQILVLNKCDAVEPEQIEKAKDEVAKNFAKTFIAVRVISAATTLQTKELCQYAALELSKTKKLDAAQEPDLIEDERAKERPADFFTVSRAKKLFFIEGDRVERLIAVTDLKDPDSLFHLHSLLQAMGVIDELIKQGAKPGAEIVAAGMTFTFGEGLL